MIAFEPVFDPPFNVVRAAYVELGVRDLAASRAFYVDRLGLLASAQSDEALHLRGLEERQHHSLVLRRAEGEPTCHAVGFKVASERELDKAAAFFAAEGLPHGFVSRAHQGRTLAARDPQGTRLEFSFEMATLPRALQRYAEYRGGHPQRLDHLNCFSPDVDAAVEFYRRLGFRLSEYTESEDDPPRYWAAWLHRKGNVHDLALTNGRGPRLHHLAYWLPGVTNIIHLCDVLSTSGYLANMERGPGRHGISNAFFLYLRDPDGHRVELFSSDYSTADPDFEPIAWKLRDAQRQTLWGHPAPQSWFEEGTPFAGVPVLEPSLAAKPIVAP